MARLLLALALAIAVPGQGVAALGSRLCVALEHHGVLAAAAADAAHEAHAAPAAPAKQSNPYSVHYTACAACGVVAGIAAPVVVSSSSAPRLTIEIRAWPAPEGRVPPGLDRPPLELPA